MNKYNEIAEIRLGEIFYKHEDLSVSIEKDVENKKLRISIFNDGHYCDDYVFDMEY